MLVAGKHIVKNREGDFFMLLEGHRSGKVLADLEDMGWYPLSNCGQYLQHRTCNNLDIMGVYEFEDVHNLLERNPESMDLKLVWERKEKTDKELQMEGIESKMRELSKQQEELADQLEKLNKGE